MGSCLSAYSDEIVIDMLATAKVITMNGSLREYSVPTRVSEVLDQNQYSTTASNFLCSSDDLYLDKDIPALNPHGDWVEIGQIYFVLPRSMLDRALKGQDMAALAVKANLALAGALGKKTSGSTSEKKRGKVMPICDLNDNLHQTYKTGSDLKKSERTSNTLLRNSGTKLRGRASVRGRCNMMSRLAAIQEVAE